MPGADQLTPPYGRRFISGLNGQGRAPANLTRTVNIRGILLRLFATRVVTCMHRKFWSGVCFLGTADIDVISWCSSHGAAHTQGGAASPHHSISAERRCVMLCQHFILSFERYDTQNSFTVTVFACWDILQDTRKWAWKSGSRRAWAVNPSHVSPGVIWVEYTWATEVDTRTRCRNWILKFNEGSDRVIDGNKRAWRSSYSSVKSPMQHFHAQAGYFWNMLWNYGFEVNCPENQRLYLGT